MRINTGLLLILIALPLALYARDAGKVSFGYIPFEVETFSSIDADVFDDSPRCVFSLQENDPRVRALIRYLGSGGRQSAKFDSGVVRLRIDGILREETVYVDRDGFFWRRNNKITGRIPRALFPSFKREIRSLARSSSCDRDGLQVW